MHRKYHAYINDSTTGHYNPTSDTQRECLAAALAAAHPEDRITLWAHGYRIGSYEVYMGRKGKTMQHMGA